MTRLATRPRFEYGNTRLRARRVARLDAGQLAGLAGRDVAGMLTALADTDLHSEAEGAIARGGGARRLHEAIRDHQARQLEQLRGFYDGAARELVDLLLARYDLHNVIALLRGVLRGGDPETTLLDIVPIGALQLSVAREIARQHEPPAAIALISGWSLPDAATAATVGAAYDAYERDGDLARLETAVTAAHAARVADALVRFGDEARDLREVLARRTDDANALTLLRLRAALGDREIDRLPEAMEWLPGGSIAPERLDDALRQADHDVTAAALADAAPHLRGPLAAFQGDLPALERALDRQRLHGEIALLRRGDPLGVAVPIGYAAELEVEARNLRTIAEGAALGLDAADLEAMLLLTEGTR